MQSTLRPGARTLIGLAAAAGAFGVAATMSVASAQTARADTFTDVINAVDDDFSAGQADFTTALSDFGSNNVNDGLAFLFAGLDSDLLGAPYSLEVGTLQLLANDPVMASGVISIQPEASFASGLSDAESLIAASESHFSTVGTDLASGDYVGAATQDFGGTLFDVASLQVLLEGVAASL